VGGDILTKSQRGVYEPGNLIATGQEDKLEKEQGGGGRTLRWSKEEGQKTWYAGAKLSTAKTGPFPLEKKKKGRQPV